MLSLLARAVAGPLRPLGLSSFSSLASWWRAAARPATVSQALLPPRYGAAPPSGLLALPLLSGPPLFPAGLKTKTSLRRRCKDCYIVRRRGRLYVCCKTNPRHKQRKL
ncbi:large ribosomal subunit protein bL36m [Larus michahellis]|uniref:large ribosomal subunit protein bL36m n=1 Tax=Larus michahellis TaxID=119627 RepID=UPI003D9B03E2